MQITISGKTLNGQDPTAVSLNRKQQTRLYRFAIEQHGTCSAHAMFASDVRAGQTHIIPQEINQQSSRLYFSLVIDIIDANANFFEVRHSLSYSLDRVYPRCAFEGARDKQRRHPFPVGRVGVDVADRVEIFGCRGRSLTNNVFSGQLAP